MNAIETIELNLKILRSHEILKGILLREVRIPANPTEVRPTYSPIGLFLINLSWDSTDVFRSESCCFVVMGNNFPGRS